MTLKRYFCVLSFALLFSQVLHPCSMIVVGGFTPTAVGQLSGVVVGSGQLSLMGHRHDEERHSLTVPGATISVKARTDIAYFKKGEVKYPKGMKHSSGNLKDWKCGSEISNVRTDQSGNFAIVGIPPGKYCVDITGPPPANDNECSSRNSVTGVCNPLSGSFIVDLVPSSPKAALVADISLQWPDCSGGSFLTLRAPNSTSN